MNMNRNKHTSYYRNQSQPFINSKGYTQVCLCMRYAQWFSIMPRHVQFNFILQPNTIVTSPYRNIYNIHKQNSSVQNWIHDHLIKCSLLTLAWTCRFIRQSLLQAALINSILLQIIACYMMCFIFLLTSCGKGRQQAWGRNCSAWKNIIGKVNYHWIFSIEDLNNTSPLALK